MGDIELEADSRVDEDDLIHIGNLEFKVIHTPGHTKGSSCLYCKEENLLFQEIHYLEEHGEEQTCQQALLRV